MNFGGRDRVIFTSCGPSFTDKKAVGGRVAPPGEEEVIPTA